MYIQTGRTKSDQLSYTISYELTPETCHQGQINLYAAQVRKEYRYQWHMRGEMSVLLNEVVVKGSSKWLHHKMIYDSDHTL